MNFWSNLLRDIEANNGGVLMYVVKSWGSSPGRKGFKMYVSKSKNIFGSIGGGIMEYKMVEYCREELNHNPFKPFLKNQIHQDGIEKDKSGMICSGEQTIAFIYLDKTQTDIINRLSKEADNTSAVLGINNKGLFFEMDSDFKEQFSFIEGQQWIYKEKIGFNPLLQIIGGGHVGLALSKFASALNFRVVLYDDRGGLNTIESNKYAEIIKIKDYHKIAHCIDQNPQSYVVIMSFGFRSDKIILTQLLPFSFKYMGMMGSKEKVKRLFKELTDQGTNAESLRRLKSPIGLPIKSETPEEIAVSIMAEIIAVKNGGV